MLCWKQQRNAGVYQDIQGETRKNGTFVGMLLGTTQRESRKQFFCNSLSALSGATVPFGYFRQFGSNSLQIIVVHSPGPIQCFFWRLPCKKIPEVTTWGWGVNPCTWLLASALQFEVCPFHVTPAKSLHPANSSNPPAPSTHTHPDTHTPPPPHISGTTITSTQTIEQTTVAFLMRVSMICTYIYMLNHPPPPPPPHIDNSIGCPTLRKCWLQFPFRIWMDSAGGPFKNK